MPQRLAQTVRAQFNKGLLTEFSELNFPAEASVDELNCDLFKAGNRAKRKGIKYEDNYSLTDETYTEGTLFHTTTWENVGLDASLQYLVVQAGNKLRFYRKGANPLSEGIVPTSDSNSDPYIVDLDTYSVVGSLGASASKIETASINGYLVVVSPQIDAFYIERDSSDGSFTESLIDFKIRDYGVYSDPDERFEAVASPDNARKYDTYNAGWEGTSYADGALATYTSGGDWPPLTHPWYSGKISSGHFDKPTWETVYAGTSLTTTGHFIIGLFNPDREGISGLPSVTYWDGREIKAPSGRFSATAGYAGRVWYTGVDSRIYYSQILEDVDQIGNLHSHNDPTAEYLSDRLETDGGYINIPEANGLKKLHVFGSSILAFAENGVWRISGIDGNLFKANDFSVFKITDFGLSARASLIGGQNSVPFWWSYTGIHTIQVTDQGGMVEVNLSRDTIQTFWDEIGGTERASVTSAYDAINNTILWMYPEDLTTEYKYNKILFLDVDLGAFYPWSISDKEMDTPYIVGTSFFSGAGSETITFNVIDSSGNQVVDSSGNEVVVERNAGTVRSSAIFFLTRDSTGSLTFSLFDGTDYLDWGTEDYSAYAESAYNFLGDLTRYKNSPYITVYMRETETGFTEVDGQYYPVEPSSLKVSAYWNFKKTSSSSPQEIYRHKGPITVDSVDDFGSPTTVLSTRLKLRGRGRVVRLRFEGQEGKAFNLLGWETIDAINPSF